MEKPHGQRLADALERQRSSCAAEVARRDQQVDVVAVPERRGRVARPRERCSAGDEHLDARGVERADRLGGGGADRLGAQALVDGGCAEDREELDRLRLAAPRVLQQCE